MNERMTRNATAAIGFAAIVGGVAGYSWALASIVGGAMLLSASILGMVRTIK